MHCDMLKIQDGVAIVEKLNYVISYKWGGEGDKRLPYLLCCLPYLFVNCLPPPAIF